MKKKLKDLRKKYKDEYPIQTSKDIEMKIKNTRYGFRSVNQT